MAHHLMGRPRTTNPDAFNNNMLWEYASHNLDSEFWRMRSARWDKITVPLYSVGNWTGVGLHLRGNTEGFMLAASKHKKLRIHTGTHFHPFHSEEGRLDQLRFFDHWLKGIDTGIMDEPPVKLQIRTGGDLKNYKFRFENEWPIARTKWTKMYLKLNAAEQNHDGKPEGELLPAAGVGGWQDHLSRQPSDARRNRIFGAFGYRRQLEPQRHFVADRAADRGYRSHRSYGARGVGLKHRLKTWTCSRRSGTSDRMARMSGRSASRAGMRSRWRRDGCVRPTASSIQSKSLPYRPYHAHDERQWLKPDEVVECHLEIWPSCMVFKKGHRIQLDVQPRDGVGASVYRHYPADYNIGAKNTIHAGGDASNPICCCR